MFTELLLGQVTISGESQNFTIPPISDPDGDGYVVEASFFLRESLPSYIKFDGTTFMMDATIPNVGLYLITVRIKDSNRHPITSWYIFSWYIEEAPPLSDQTENGTDDDDPNNDLDTEEEEAEDSEEQR